MDDPDAMMPEDMMEMSPEEKMNMMEEEPIDDDSPPDNGPWYCSICVWLGTMYTRFDKPFITFFMLQSFNHGLWIIATLAVKDYYKDYLGLDPGEMQIYMSIIHIPWSFKILYGLISDNVPLCGTRRKSWLIIMGILQFLALMSLFIFEFDDPLVVALVLAIASMSEAFVNVVSDAIMVIQSRKDKKFGSQDFVTLMYLTAGTGGVIGCIFGGLMTMYYHPKWCFFWYSWMGLVIAIAACFLTKESELDKVGDDEAVSDSDISTSLENYEASQRRQMIEAGMDATVVNERQIEKRDGFCYNLKKNCQAIGRAVKMREIYFIVIFFIAKGILNPTFEEFSYFFLLNVIGISKFMFALLVLIGNICHVVGALFYKAFCRSVETRWMVLFAMLVQVVATFLNFCFAKRWNKDIGIDDLVFLLFTDIVFSVVGTLLYTLPILALFAKITPAKIEGTIFAFLTGTMNLASTVISPGMGTFINHQFVGVNKKDLSGYSTLCLIAFIGSILTIALLPLIPTKEQIIDNRIERKEADNEKRRLRKERRAKKMDDEAPMMENMDMEDQG